MRIDENVRNERAHSMCCQATLITAVVQHSVKSDIFTGCCEIDFFPTGHRWEIIDWQGASTEFAEYRKSQ